MAPAGTPAAIIARLNAEIVRALKEPETAKLIEAQAIQIVASTPEEFAAFIRKDVVLWKEVAKQARIEVK
jgi:tripartite-type tricarboxylate transporter receptor subunit TctC